MFLCREMSSPLSVGAKLPLFVFPTSLTFYCDDPTSHQQLLTIYNPYNFSLRYKGKYHYSLYSSLCSEQSFSCGKMLVGLVWGEVFGFCYAVQIEF